MKAVQTAVQTGLERYLVGVRIVLVGCCIFLRYRPIVVVFSLAVTFARDCIMRVYRSHVVRDIKRCRDGVTTRTTDSSSAWIRNIWQMPHMGRGSL